MIWISSFAENRATCVSLGRVYSWNLGWWGNTYGMLVDKGINKIWKYKQISDFVAIGMDAL